VVENDGKRQNPGFLNENDGGHSVPNLGIILGIVGGFICFFVALYLDRPEAYIPAGGITMAALSAVGVKAYKKTS